MADVYILSAVRTPIGKYLGSLAEVPAVELGSRVVAAAMERAGAAAGQVDEVILGSVLQAGLGQNPARQSALRAGLPDRTPCLTINKVCGSGLKAVMLAAQAIRAGEADLLVAGGMENMSRAPHLLFGTRQGWRLGDQKAVDAMIHDGLWCAFEQKHMGESAEYIAEKYDLSRADLDRYAVQSHQRAFQAWEKGLFARETLPIAIGAKGGTKTVARDEGVRADSTLETLAKLRPSFREGGRVTAGNASMISDGAAALVVASGRAAERLERKPQARVVAAATSGVAPREIFIAPALAVRMVLEKARLNLKDIDLFEINEAFAAQMLACLKELRLDEDRVNVHGGAIALGHPIGASGARVLVTLLHALEERGGKRGLATLCLGGGNAVAMIVERV